MKAKLSDGTEVTVLEARGSTYAVQGKKGDPFTVDISALTFEEEPEPKKKK